MVLLLQVIRIVSLALLNSMKPKTGRGKTILNLVLSTFNYMIVILGIFWGMSIIGVDLATLFASLGIMALVIGFGAESLIADIITGIFLVFEDDFNVGDIVEYSGFRGTVDSIGIRVTCIKDGGGNVKIVNNSDIRGILNRSKSTSRAVCDIPISYNANLEEVEVVLKKILAKLPEQYPDQFPSAPDYVGVQALGASSVDLRVSAQVSESNLFSATRIMNREIKIGFDKAGVEIPFQQIVVHKAED
jgi:small conductance mechanosensitive channel